MRGIELLGGILNANKQVFHRNVTGGTPQLVMDKILGIYLTIDHSSGNKRVYVVSLYDVTSLTGNGDALLSLQNDQIYVYNPNSDTRRFQVFLL